MATRSRWARGFARVVVACALLAGLFLMHGLATLDCHTASLAPGVSAAPMPGMAVPGLSVPAGAAMSNVSSTGDTGGTPTGTSGGVCVSTPPTPGVAGLIALLLLAVGGAPLLGATLTGSTTHLGRRRRRAPPPLAGSGLLLSLCISRT